MKIVRDFEYKLLCPVKYSAGADFKDAKMLLISSPSNRQIKIASKLKQYVMEAVGKMRNEFKGNDKEIEAAANAKKDDGSEAAASYTMIMQMAGIEMEQVYDIFERLLLDGKTCLLDGKEPLKSINFGDMDFRDTERLLGEYIAHFFM